MSFIFLALRRAVHVRALVVEPVLVLLLALTSGARLTFAFPARTLPLLLQLLVLLLPLLRLDPPSSCVGPVEVGVRAARAHLAPFHHALELLHLGKFLCR